MLLLAAPFVSAFGQETGADSARSFGVLSPPPPERKEIHFLTNMWGANLAISTNGLGLGAFYRHEYSEDWAGFIDLTAYEAQDDNQVEYYDPYTGEEYVPGKINRFLVFPLMFGFERRMFADDIIDNFRPFITGGVGPTMIYVFPYDQEYFSALGSGHPVWTGAGFLGIGSYFGNPHGSVLGFNLRYYFVPHSGLPSMQATDGSNAIYNKSQFGGFNIGLSFGAAN
jgi:hypothetical protein